MRRLITMVAVATLALGLLAAPAVAKGGPPVAPPLSIVDIVVSNPDIDDDGEGDFDILLAAVLAADPSIASALGSRGQYTVFAPTDAAFVSLLGELGLTADELLANTDLVTEVLLYHVARGNRDSADVLGSERIRTLNGGFLLQDGGVLTDNNDRTSNIIAVDVPASNGIVHVIDTVVLP